MDNKSRLIVLLETHQDELTQVNSARLKLHTVYRSPYKNIGLGGKTIATLNQTPRLK